MKLISLCTACILGILACQSGSNGKDSRSFQSGPERPLMEESRSKEGSSTDQIPPDVARHVIRNGFMSMKVDNAQRSKAEVETIVATHKGFIGNEQFDNNDYTASYHLQIRVPAIHLNALIATIEGMKGQVTNKSIQARDVTEEFIDLESRLENKRSYLHQFMQLLKNAKSIEDILKVQERIRILEEEIESTEGRLQYLRNQESLSTLELTLMEEKAFVFKPDRSIHFFERLKDSLSAGWHGFVEFLLVMVGIWPFWLVLAVFVWAFRKLNRRKKKVPVPPSDTITNS